MIADNGYFHADRGLADKWYPYEQALRVPLIVRDPRLPSSRRGATRDQIVLNIDEFFYEHPTITSRDRIPSSQGVIRRDWKYVYWPEFAYEQLLNLKQDSEEIRHLANEPAAAD